MSERFWSPSGPSTDAWFHIGSFAVTTSALLPFVGFVSMFVYAIDKSLLVWLEFEPWLVTAGQVWRVATWPVPNAPSVWVVLGLILFYFWGSMLEGEIGRVRFLRYLVVCTVIPATVMSLAMLVVRATGQGNPLWLSFTSVSGGIRLLGTALLVVIALVQPSIRFMFGIPIRIAAAVFVGIDVLQLLGDRLWGPLILELLVVAVAVVTLKTFGIAVHAMPMSIPQLPLPALITGYQSGGNRRAATARGSDRAKRPKQKKGAVVTGPWGESGTGSAVPNATPSSRTGLNRTDREEVDRLLDKIAASGMGSLSSDERTRLEDASKRLRESGQ